MSVERLPAVDHDRCKSCGQPVPRSTPEQRLRAPFEPRPRKGGRQIAYGVALRALTAYFVRCGTDEKWAEGQARKLLNPCLPVKQRKPRTR